MVVARRGKGYAEEEEEEEEEASLSLSQSHLLSGRLDEIEGIYCQ